MPAPTDRHTKNKGTPMVCFSTVASRRNEVAHDSGAATKVTDQNSRESDRWDLSNNVLRKLRHRLLYQSNRPEFVVACHRVHHVVAGEVYVAGNVLCWDVRLSTQWEDSHVTYRAIRFLSAEVVRAHAAWTHKCTTLQASTFWR